MKNVLVFGATGMAGHMVTMYLSQFKVKYNVFNVCYRNKLDEKSFLCDIGNISQVTEIVEKTNPDVIINCVGVLNKTAESDIKNTVYVNTFFPKFLARLGELKKIKIIHLSTDCVFSGEKGGYTETSFKDENGIYGLSKNLGEIYNGNSLTIRTSIIGPELKNGSGLFHWFMSQDGEINGFKKAFWTGITTLELAKIIDRAIDEDIKGLYHMVPSSKISKYDLLNIFKKEFSKYNITIKENSDYACDKSLIRTDNKFNFKVSTYEKMIKEMKDWMIEHKDFYDLYFYEELCVLG
ncbi:dTDP-4-dehydrorhamnose reductase family protein [Paraclostridium bifermentans]|uniref:dTDP-4-dehydrorhamnose reductase family protein n=1 Tax=Paraclostridium bifermentans TaxID=1490 RepID=UPI0025AF7FD4|nr:SDR family oxidoreductase [Paraclostridium bifermentans]